MTIEKLVVRGTGAAWKLISTAIWVQAALTSLLGLALLRTRPGAGNGSAVVKSILVVRLDEIGDIVMTSPFFRGLRQLYPEAWISLVVKPGIAPLFAHCPYVDEVLTYDQRGPSWSRPFVLPWRALRFAARNLRSRRYDMALLPRWDTDYYYAAYLAFFSGAPRRIGFSSEVIGRKRKINRGYDLLLTEALTDKAARSEIAHSLKMVEHLGASAPAARLEIWLDDADRTFAANFLTDRKIGESSLIGIGPAGGHSRLKQWPLENFAELARRLQARYHAKIVLFGGPGEEELGEALTEKLNGAAISLIGKTTLRQSAALMECCQVYIGNDSGPTHLAAAAGIPVVAIFGSSCRHRYQPGGNTRLVWRDLPCSPCQVRGHDDRCQVCIFSKPHCLTEISVDEVERAVQNQIAEGKG